MAVRAHVTLLFCDLVESTALLSQVGEAASDELRHAVFAALRRPIEVHGGDEVKSQGDGLMVAFRQHPADAVAAAVAMQQAIWGLDRQQPDLRLAVRIGISTGEATAEGDDWFGTPVVEAARLCGAAAPGQVLVGASVHEAVPVLSDRSAPVGPLSLKGFPAPRPAWAVAIERDAGLPLLPPGLDPVGEPPFQDREDALAAIEAAASGAEGGSPHLVVVRGDAGSGKTRLVAEAAARVAGRGAVVVAGRCESVGEPLAAVVGAVRWRHLASGDVSRAVHADNVLDRLRALAGRGAAVLVIDDAQRASPALLSWVAEVLEGPAPTPVAIVSLFRREPAGPDRALDRLLAKVAGAPGLVEIDLPPLAPPAVTAILQPAVAEWLPLRPGPVPEDVVRAVMLDTAGLPGGVVTARRLLAHHDALGDVGRARQALAAAAPYKGLAPFAAADAAFFFGREAVVDALRARLDDSRVLAVLGPSGSGKSSLVRAGLLAGDASAAFLTPGAQPMAAWTAALAARPRTLFVDQLEEAFTLTTHAAERDAFLDALVETATAPAGPTVIVALRSDFFAPAAAHPGLAPLLEEHAAIVPPMTADELRSAIEGPAEVAGLRFEPGLAELIVADVLGEPGGLPLLSHALLETWRRRRGRVLTIADYREAGGAKGAIARTADTVYAELLTGEEQSVARTTFLRLTELGEGVEDTRRRASRAELALGADAAVVERVLGVLIDHRLVVAVDEHVEVAHEALIREWPRLRGWLDDDREAIRAHRRLAGAAADWAALGRRPEDLYRGLRLEAALDSRPRSAAAGLALSPDEESFLAASIAARDLDRAEAEARERDQLRTNRRLRALLVAAGIGLLGAVLASVVAVGQRNRADDEARLAADQARVAEQTADIATARLLATRVPDVLENQPDLALLLAVEAHRLHSSPETRNALARSLLRRPSLLGLRHTAHGPFRSARPLAGGDLVALTDVGLERWSGPSPEPETVLELDAVALAVDPSGTTIGVAGTDGTVTVLEATTGAVLQTWSAAGPVRALAVSDSSLVAVASGDGRIDVRDERGLAAGPTLDGGSLAAAIAFGPGPGELVSVDALGMFRIHDIASGRTVREFAGPLAGSAVAVAGRSLVVAGDAGDLTAVLDLDTGQTLQMPVGDRLARPDATGEVGTAASISAPNRIGIGGDLVPPVSTTVRDDLRPGARAAASPDGRLAIAAAGRDVVVVTVTDDGTAATRIEPGVGAIIDLAVTADGSEVVITGERTSARWSLQGRPALASAVFDAGLLASGDVEAPRPPSITGAISPGGTRVVLTGGLGPSRVVDRASGEPVTGLITGFARFADDETLVVGRAEPLSFERFDIGTGARSETIDVSPFAAAIFATTPERDALFLSNGRELRVLRRAPSGASRIDLVAVALAEGENIQGIAVRAGGTDLALATTTGVLVVDADSGRVRHRLELDDGATAVAYGPSRTADLLAAASPTGVIRLHDADTVAPVGELRGHTDAVTELVVDPDGERLASFGTDGTVRLWDLTARQLVGDGLPTVAALDAPAVRGGTISFSTDGRTLLAPSPAGVVAWMTDPADWERAACTVAGRDLTEAEWAEELPEGTPYRSTCR